MGIIHQGSLNTNHSKIGIINYIKELESIGGESSNSLNSKHDSDETASKNMISKNIDSGAYGLVVMTSPSHLKSLRENDLNEYLDFFELSGITFKHKKETKRAITKYLSDVNWRIEKQKSLVYFKMLQKRCSTAYYKKQMYQIMKFLKHLGHDWVNGIKLPPDPFYNPKRVTSDDIYNTLEYLKHKDHYKRN